MSDYKNGVAYVFDTTLINASARPDLKAAPTLAAGDVKISKDEGAFANLATLPTVTPAGGTNVKVSLSATEATSGRVAIAFIDQSSPKEWDDVHIYLSSTAVTVDDLVRSSTPANELNVDSNNRAESLLGAVTHTGAVLPVVSDVTNLHASSATSSAQATAQSDLDKITGVDGVTLATSQGLYAPAKAGDNMGTVSSVTGNVNGSVGSVATAITLPTIPANWITAAGINALALDGKGNWNIGKTGYTLTLSFPTNFSSLGIEVGGAISTLNGHTAQTADHTAAIGGIPTVTEFNERTLASADYFDATADTVATVTNLTNKTGFSLAATGLDLITSTATGVIEIAKAFWDRVLSKSNHNIGQSGAKMLRELGTLIAAEGAVTGTPTTTSITTNITGYDNNFFRDQVFAAYNGAAQAGQGRVITTYNGTSGVFTFDEPFTTALIGGDDVVILTIHVHSITEIQDGLATEAKQDAIKAVTDVIPDAGALTSIAQSSQCVDILTKLPFKPTKGVAFSDFKVFMVLASDSKTGATGLTVSGLIQQGTGSFTALTNSIVEIGNGMYRVDLTAAEMNADSISLIFTAATADARVVTMYSQAA